MTTPTTTDAAAIEPLGHREAMQLQEAEMQRVVDLLRTLSPDDWSAQTECPDWDVRRMWLHVLGACEGSASMREGMHQMRCARRLRKQAGSPLEVGLSTTQVADRIDLEPAELIDRLERIAPKTVRARGRLPRPVRAIKIAIDAPVVERWSLGYLNDTIYLRDVWMHRIDTCRAVGREFEATSEHDGRIVADVVGEWARRHGQPFTLELSGPAGGSFGVATGGEALQMDAIDFCRVLAGRGEATGLLATIVPF